MRRTHLFLAFFCLTLSALAQDVHFSQFDEAPQLLNPGNTGVFRGDFRIAANYRDQWGSIENPYRTFGFNYDHRAFHNKWKRASLAFGLAAFRDDAGDLGLHTTSGVISVAGTVHLTGEQSLTAGIQSGIIFRGLNPANMVWGNQYDGVNYDPTMASGEIQNFNNFLSPDVSFGLAWTYEAPEGFSRFNDLRITVGTGLFHLNQPQQLFNLGEEDYLHIKWVLHANALIGLGSGRSFVLPKFMFALQGPSTNAVFGGIYQYMVKESAKVTGWVRGASIGAGLLYRWDDALIPVIQVEFDQYAIGISYDVNVSGLRRASAYMGGLEVSLRFISVGKTYYSGRQFKTGK